MAHHFAHIAAYLYQLRGVSRFPEWQAYAIMSDRPDSRRRQFTS